MPLYNYKALTKEGKEVKSSLQSDNITQAKQKLQSIGVILISIEEEKSSGKSLALLSNRVSIQELSLMTRQLATLIKAKIQVVDALRSLMDQVESQRLKIVLSEIKQKISEGTSLARAFADYPNVFNNIYVNMVEAGEASGNLDIVLLRLAEFTESQSKLKNKVKGALTYPIIMGCFGLIMMTFIFTVIIPKITKIFIQMKRDLPLPTQICIGISYFLKEYWWLGIIIVVVSIYLFRKYINTQSGRSVWDKFLLKFPLLGEIIVMINVARFCSTLATLLNSGVPILASLNIVKNLISNVHMQKAIENAKINVAEGSSMAPALEESGVFPPLITHMIKLGEKSGELESMLRIVSQNYEGQVNAKLDGLTSTLEPIMMVIMGLVVGFIVMAVIVPMMSLTSMR